MERIQSPEKHLPLTLEKALDTLAQALTIFTRFYGSMDGEQSIAFNLGNIKNDKNLTALKAAQSLFETLPPEEQSPETKRISTTLRALHDCITNADMIFSIIENGAPLYQTLRKDIESLRGNTNATAIAEAVAAEKSRIEQALKN